MIIEVLADGPGTTIDRARLEEGVAGGAEWVVVTQAPGGRPDGIPPPGGILVSTAPVAEAVKIVEGGRVVGSVDRAELVEVVLPAVLERTTLAEVLARPGDPVDLVAGVVASGGRVTH